MRLLYVTDLHGDKTKYEEVLRISNKEDINVIINGGDMLPKNEGTISQLNFIKYSLRNYFEILKEKEISYLCMLGNDDLKSFDKDFINLCNSYSNVFNLAQNIVTINGYEFIGMNYILDNPFSLKDRVVSEDYFVPEKQLIEYAVLSNGFTFDYIYDWENYSKNNLINIREILNSLPKPNDLSKTTYIMHMPPCELGLGCLKSKDKDIGSKAIYDFIKERQPLLSLHGHIHEAPDTKNGTWINEIDNTICINPGQTEYGSKKLVYSIIDLEKKSYKRLKKEIKGNGKYYF